MGLNRRGSAAREGVTAVATVPHTTMTTESSPVRQVVAGLSQRREALARLEQERQSRVLVIAAGVRPPAAAGLAWELLDVLPSLLERTEYPTRKRQLDIVLLGSFGNTAVPAQLLRLLQEYCGQVAVLLPQRVSGAPALLALGADHQVFGDAGLLVLPRSVSLWPTTVPARAWDFGGDARLQVSDDYEEAEASIANEVRAALAAGSGAKSRVHAHMLATAVAAGMDGRELTLDAVAAKSVGLSASRAAEEANAALTGLAGAYGSLLHDQVPIWPSDVLDDRRYASASGDLSLAALETTQRSLVYRAGVKYDRQLPIPSDARFSLDLRVAPSDGGDAEVAYLGRVRSQVARSVQAQLMRQASGTSVRVAIRGGRWEQVGT